MSSRMEWNVRIVVKREFLDISFFENWLNVKFFISRRSCSYRSFSLFFFFVPSPSIFPPFLYSKFTFHPAHVSLKWSKRINGE